MKTMAVAGVGSVPTAAAAIGGPALVRLGVLLALALGALCWILVSPARTANFVDIIKA